MPVHNKQTADVKIVSIFWINQNITQKILEMHVAYK